MNHKSKNNDDGSVLVSVSLSKEEAQKNYKDAISQIKNTLSIKGFRKGSAPDKIVKQNSGDRVALAFEENSLKTTVSKVLENEKISSVLSPEIKITKSVPGEILEYEMIVVPSPVVKLGEYANFKLKKKKISIDESEIDKALEFLRQSRANFKTTDAPAKKEQHIEIGFDAFIDGKKSEQSSEKFYPLRLGKSHLHPDFEKEIYGMKTNDKKSFNIKFDSKWSQKEFANKNVKFDIVINSIQDVKVPNLDENFAKSLGDFSTIESLKKSLREGLKQEKQQEEEAGLKDSVLKKIVKNAKITVPKVLINKEKDNLEKNFLSDLEKKKLKLEDYLKRTKSNKEALKEGFEKRAKARLESTFVINEIAKKENLFPSKEEMELEINNWLKKIENSKQSPKDIDLERLESYTFEYLTNNKVIDWLLDKNTCV